MSKSIHYYFFFPSLCYENLLSYIFSVLWLYIGSIKSSAMEKKLFFVCNIPNCDLVQGVLSGGVTTAAYFEGRFGFPLVAAAADLCPAQPCIC